MGVSTDEICHFVYDRLCPLKYAPNRSFYSVEPSNHKLYIRLPVKIKDEFQIRELHQNIVQVHLPRQKSRRWCIIDFENKEKLQETVVALKKIRIENKSIKIGAYKKGGNKTTSSEKTTKSTRPLLKLLKKSN